MTKLTRVNGVTLMTEVASERYRKKSHHFLVPTFKLLSSAVTKPFLTVTLAQLCHFLFLANGKLQHKVAPVKAGRRPGEQKTIVSHHGNNGHTHTNKHTPLTVSKQVRLTPSPVAMAMPNTLAHSI